MTRGHHLSVIIITKNEEDNLERCLLSLPRGCEIIIVDSFSTDRTIDIAKRWSCKVFQRFFVDYADQKNFALSKVSHNWVLSIDADEQLLDWQEDSLSRIQHSGCKAFYISRRLCFMEKILRFGKTRDKPLRIFHRANASFVGAIHEVLSTSERHPRLLKGPSLLHYSYKNLDDYFRRFNKYTSAIAANHEKNKKQISFMGHLIRPWLEFINRYFLRLGFLDGYAGYTYALISSLYAYIKYAKFIEKRELK